MVTSIGETGIPYPVKLYHT